MLPTNPTLPTTYRPLAPDIIAAYNRYRPSGPQPLLCYVPFSSLTFSFKGKVHACTYNRDVVVGEYPKQTIAQIWQGTEMNNLRQHLQHHDLNYGCQHCKYFFEKQKFTGLKPPVFDPYAHHTHHPYPRVMEFEMSNTCNLECIMCSGQVSSSIRTHRDHLPPLPMPYDDAFVTQLREFIPHLHEAKFYGGEPFLIPIYYQIWEAIAELKPELPMFVITNGTVLNSRVKDLLQKGRFELAVSIDALDKTKLESIRKNVHLETLLEHIDYFSTYSRQHHRPFTLSFTVQKNNWDQLPLIIQYCNTKQAHLYISYLETPVALSLADCTTAELEHIYQTMMGYSFATTTGFEQYNHRCFEDFKAYLRKYISNPEEKKYFAYKFPEADQTLPANAPLPDPVPVATNAAALLKEQIRSYLATQPASDAEADLRFNNIAAQIRTILTLFNTNEQQQLLSVWLKTDTAQLIGDMEQENLRLTAYKAYSALHQNTYHYA